MSRQVRRQVLSRSRRRSALAILVAMVGTFPIVPVAHAQDAEKPASLDEVLNDLSQQPDPPRRRPRGGGQGRQGGPPPQDAAPPPAPAAAEPKTDKPDVFFAVTGATVHTVSGPVLEGATILCKNGKIQAIGRGIKVPEKAEILDAAGFHVYPGLVAVRSLSIVGGDPPEDTSDPYTLPGVAALAAGITTVYTGNSAAKNTFGTIDNIVVRRNLFETIRYRTSDPAGKKRLRESFERVRQYIRDLKAYEDNKARDPSLKAPDDRLVKSGEGATHYRLLKGEAVALVDADTANDILQLCDLVTEYGFECVIRGAREGWTVAPQMGRAGVSAIVTPRTRDDPDPRLLRPSGATIQNAAKLYEHGVHVAVIPQLPGVSFGGLGGRDLMQLNLEAAFAVRGGLSEDAAVRTITLDAARVLGVDDRVGSIEPGKDADFVIIDRASILDYTALARWTVVNGEVMYDKSKEPLLRHIRPDGGTETPAPKDFWPRRLGDDL